MTSERPRLLIYSQDGLGFSGPVAPNPLGDKVVMTSHAAWPSRLTKGFRSSC